MRKNNKRAIILRILIVLFKISGVIPLTYSRKQKLYSNKKGFLHYISRPSLLYNFLLIGIVIGLYVLTTVLYPNYIETWIKYRPLGSMETIGAGVVAIMLWIVFFIKRNDVTETIDSFLEIDDLLHKHYWSYWSKGNERKCVGMLFFYLIFLILVFCFLQYDKVSVLPTVSYQYGISKLLISICILKYSLLCLIIKDMVQCLNEIFSNFHTASSYPSDRVKDFKNVRCMYCLVWDIRGKINEMFGLPILIIITYVSFGMIHIVAVTVNEFIAATASVQLIYIVQLSVIAATYMLFWTTTTAVEEVRLQKFTLSKIYWKFTCVYT